MVYLVADWLIIWSEFIYANSFLNFSFEKIVQISSKKKIVKIVQKNSDPIINQSATRSTVVQFLIVYIDQNYNFMKNPREKIHFCRYELRPFSSSFMAGFRPNSYAYNRILSA